MKSTKIRPLILGILIVLCFVPSPAFALSTLACWGYGIVEVLVPGVGYALLNDWEKAAVFGSTRWITRQNARYYTKQSDYEKDPKKIYVTEKRKDKTTQQDIFLTRSTYYGKFYSSLHQNLTFASIHDLYDQNCETNPYTYQDMASPFQLADYGTELTFLIPIGGLIGSLSLAKRNHITYHVKDLTRTEMQATSFIQNQLTGVGEEMLFRGVIQRSFYNVFSQHYNQQTARWSSILAASTIFGLAHNGVGGSATPGAAFLFGIYLGWIYHPAEGGFDLQQAIALHSWWNTIVGYNSLSHHVKDYKQSNHSEALKKNSAIPLINFTYHF